MKIRLRVIFIKKFLTLIFVFLDKFVKPRGGAIKNIDTKATGITREHIENLGEDFHSVREEAIEGKFY